MPYMHGGEIRHTFINGDGTKENVSLNNLIALMARFCSDAYGNRFGAYIVVPKAFWNHLEDVIKGQYGIDPDLLKRNSYGGVMGILQDVTIYVGGTSKVLLRSDHNELRWSFSVGRKHKLLGTEEILEIAGMGKGFDPEVVFLPWLHGYAPMTVLKEWAAEGIPGAREALDRAEKLLDSGQRPLLSGQIEISDGGTITA